MSNSYTKEGHRRTVGFSNGGSGFAGQFSIFRMAAGSPVLQLLAGRVTKTASSNPLVFIFSTTCD
jgi:hypothetical protein